MDQSNGDEVKALKESVSRLAISIKNADPEKREGLKSSWDSTVARLNFLGWSVVGPDPFDGEVKFQEVAIEEMLERVLDPTQMVPSRLGGDSIPLKQCGLAVSLEGLKDGTVCLALTKKSKIGSQWPAGS